MPATRTQWIVALALAWAAVSPGRDALAGPAEDQYAVAAGHYNQGRWQLAHEEFDRFLTQHAGHSKADRALFYSAESLVQLQRFEEAAERFRQYRSQVFTGTLSLKALFRAGECSYLAGRIDEAGRDLDQFIIQAPGDPLHAYALPYLGDIALRKRDGTEAANRYRAALDRFADGPLADDCRYGLARARELTGEPDQALPLYQHLALGQGQWADDAQFRLAAVHYEAGDFADALEALESLESKFPKSRLRDKAALAAGQSLYFLHRYDEARARLAPLEERHVGLEARYWRGLVSKAEQQWEDAARILLSAAGDFDQRTGSGADADQPAGLANPDQQRGADAAAAPLGASMRLHAAESLLELRRHAQATQQYDLILERWSDCQLADDALLGKIRSAQAAGLHDAVEPLAEEFSRLFSQSALSDAVVRARAESLLAGERFDRVIELLRPHVGQAPGPAPAPGAVHDDMQHQDGTRHEPACRLLLAAALQGLSRHDEALSQLETVLSTEAGPLTTQARRLQAASLVASEKFELALEPLERYLADCSSDRSGSDEAAPWAKGQLALCQARTGRMDEARATFGALAVDHAGHEAVEAAARALAEAAMAQGDYPWAAELFARLTGQTDRPASRAEGLAGLAWSQLKSGKLAEAADSFGRLLEQKPDDALAVEAALARGYVLARLGQADPALVMYRRVIDQHPGSPRLPQALLAAARLHDELEQDNEAAALYERLDREFAGHSQGEAALYEWAWVLRDRGRHDEADALFERLRQATPPGRLWADAVFRLAERAFELKDFDRSGRLIDELLAGQPSDDILPHALWLQAQLAIAAEQWQESCEPLQRLVEQFPDHPLRLLAMYWMAEAAYRQEQDESAAEQLTRLAHQARGRTDGWLAMVPLRQAQLHARHNRWSEALELARSIETAYPDFEQQYEVDYLVGRALASQAEFDQARQAYRRVVQSAAGGKSETAAMAQWMIGESYFHQRDYESALREYLRVEILYDYPTWQAGALLQAGKCHELLGQWDQAGRLYERLLDNYPGTQFHDEAQRRHHAAQARRTTDAF